MKFNKRGDLGTTSLLFGERTSKFDLRVETYGTIDEAVSTLGLARATSPNEKVKEKLLYIQKELFVLGAELATPKDHRSKLKDTIDSAKVELLEKAIEELEKEVDIGSSFIIPGNTVSSAAIDMGRTVIRRTERLAGRLRQEGTFENVEILRYLNRLADFLFTLARYEEFLLKETAPRLQSESLKS
ncbi:MAG: cob(I)yrinic acid a,c-diamide adenosyltransferase [Candidatus Tectomicrobia bacterium]|uniref:Corrinoid adenosyltransferase n=1 Tax=Tectimicrobiota bacterium TaxID=2528274 RepID=A0A933GNY6_UNCTE|nr:cob(I)yrinic acid a,c-diamide adenosyltransferase [Candidatus Tectomicrobia bacterium]